MGACSKESDQNGEGIPKRVIWKTAKEMGMFNWETRRLQESKIKALKHLEDGQEKKD